VRLAEQLGHVEFIDKLAVNEEALEAAAFDREAHAQVQPDGALVMGHNGELQASFALSVRSPASSSMKLVSRSSSCFSASIAAAPAGATSRNRNFTGAAETGWTDLDARGLITHAAIMPQPARRHLAARAARAAYGPVTSPAGGAR
jgi:hypothetical protein